MSTKTIPPTVERIDHKSNVHGHERNDPYFWLREKTNQKVIDYLNKENEYLENDYLKSVEPLQNQINEEFKARIQQTDENVPYRKKDWFYYTRTVEGKQYALQCRKKRLENGEMSDEEQIIMDLNKISDEEQLSYLSLGVMRTTPDHNILAYSLDKKGDEVYTLYFKDLRTGEQLPGSGQLSNMGRSLQFYNDGVTFLYTTLDNQQRPYKVHKLTMTHDFNPSHPEALYTEPDERFFVGISKSLSEAFITIRSCSKTTTEVHYVDANEPSSPFTCFKSRVQDVEYYMTHHQDHFYIYENSNKRTNFRLIRVPITRKQINDFNDDNESIEQVLAYQHDRHIEGITCFKTFMAIWVRQDGLPKLLIKMFDEPNEQLHEAKMPHEAYDLSSGVNEQYDANVIRIYYSSFVNPDSWFDYNPVTRHMTLLKQKKVVGGFDPSLYTTERLMIPSSVSPNVKIPVSLVYRTDKRRANEPMACLLYGYGSYGISYDPSFDILKLSLLDRGFVYAIGHIRGGGEFGRTWYDDGKMQNKLNTFVDFVDCAKGLIAQGYTCSDKLAISGGSAGGLLMGACINMEPDLFKSAILKVPFVDAVNTMLDASIPLTVTEYEEWGNPELDEKVFDYISKYSPYDNIRTERNRGKRYPSMLVTSGLNDPRVQYWEPTKYVAAMRHWLNEIGQDSTRILLKTNMGAGHGGNSGRYERWKDEAFVYAFIIKELNVE